MTETRAIIPARMNSSRLPGKPLMHICGIPMIGHCVERTRIAVGQENTFLATCDQEIADYGRQINCNVIMTSENHNRAATRTQEAVEKIEEKLQQRINSVLMVQGDEPLVTPAALNSAITALRQKGVSISNVISRIKTKKAFEDKNNVKVVTNLNDEVLYFSREPIPSSWLNPNHSEKFLQTGIIAFKRDALDAFGNGQETNLEILESVDMNRVLELGIKIKAIRMQAATIGVDNLADLKQAEKKMRACPIFASYNTHFDI